MKTLILKKCIELNINLFYCNLFGNRILIRVFQNGKKFANIEVVMISTFNKYSSKEKIANLSKILFAVILKISFGKFSREINFFHVVFPRLNFLS
jgi:hypothetical protein